MTTQSQTPAAAPGAPIANAPASAPKAKAIDPMSLTVDPKAENITSSLGLGMTMSGTLKGSGGIIIKGTFEGDVIIEDDEHGKAGTVFVAETGVVRGMIRAARIVICGEVESVVSTAHLVLTRSAKISGHTFYDQLASEAGAQIEGVTRRIRPGVDPVAEVMASRTRVSGSRDGRQGGGTAGVPTLAAANS